MAGSAQVASSCTRKAFTRFCEPAFACDPVTGTWAPILVCNGERTIQRALHGGHARQIQTGIRLSLGGAQHAEHDGGHREQQDREHYVEARRLSEWL